VALAYEITGVQDSQVENPLTQDVVNTYDVFFAIPAKGYAADVQVPKSEPDVVAAIKTAVETEVNRVEQIFALSTTTAPAP
jgi:p-aminobenzoyl-glutamate transporter AbgT